MVHGESVKEAVERHLEENETLSRSEYITILIDEGIIGHGDIVFEYQKDDGYELD